MKSKILIEQITVPRVQTSSESTYLHNIISNAIFTCQLNLFESEIKGDITTKAENIFSVMEYCINVFIEFDSEEDATLYILTYKET